MTYIEELHDVIRRLQVSSRPMSRAFQSKRYFEGKTVWEGIVEVFDLIGHAKAPKSFMRGLMRQTIPKGPTPRHCASSWACLPRRSFRLCERQSLKEFRDRE